MSGRRLLPLMALLIVLVIAAVVLKRQPPPMRLADEVGFERLVPQAFDSNRISALELYQGATPEEVVRLERQNGTWVVASHYDTPAQADKIKRLLTTLSTLEGELRSDQAALLADFDLETAQALHLQIYFEDRDTPGVHLLAGKSRGRNGFMRLADDPRVYSVNLNLRHEAGLSRENTNQSLPAKAWMDLQIQSIPNEQITEVALQTPARHWHFIRQPSPPLSADAPQPPVAAARQWKLTEPNVPYEVKQDFLDGLVSTLRTLRADDVANPAHIAEYGLDKAVYRAILTVQPAGEQEARQVTLLVGNEVPEQAGKHYARLGQEGPIYLLPQWAFHRLFPKSRDLLALRILRLQSQDITRLTWQTGEESWTLERHSQATTATAKAPETSAWRLREAPRFPVDIHAVTTLLDSITQLTADDWIEPPTQSNSLDQPLLTLSLTLREGRTEQLTLGQDDHGHYARRPGTPSLFVVPEASYTTLLKTLATLHPSDAPAVSTAPASP
jgi:hypothetical protein